MLNVFPAAALFLLPVLLWSAAPQTATNDSSDIDLLINARLQVRAAKLDEAAQSTRDFLQKHPASAQAHFLLGYILFKEGQANAAVASTQDKAGSSLAEYTEGAKYGLPSSLDLKIVALDYVLLGDYSDADTWLTRSLSRNPNDGDAWYDLGRVKQSEDKAPGALQAFERCLEIDPLNTRAEAARKKLETSEVAH